MFQRFCPGDLFKIAANDVELRAYNNGSFSRTIAGLNEGDSVVVISQLHEGVLQENWVKVMTRRGLGWVSRYCLIEHDLVDE